MAGERASAASLHHPADYRVRDADLDGKNASDCSIPRSILSDLALAECESLYDTAALTSKQTLGPLLGPGKSSSSSSSSATFVFDPSCFGTRWWIFEF